MKRVLMLKYVDPDRFAILMHQHFRTIPVESSLRLTRNVLEIYENNRAQFERIEILGDASWKYALSLLAMAGDIEPDWVPVLECSVVQALFVKEALLMPLTSYDNALLYATAKMVEGFIAQGLREKFITIHSLVKAFRNSGIPEMVKNKKIVELSRVINILGKENITVSVSRQNGHYLCTLAKDKNRILTVKGKTRKQALRCLFTGFIKNQKKQIVYCV